MENEKTNLIIRKLKKQVKGITLIALVVTIIVLLILAGIALNLTIGQNGIFSRAQTAANTWRNAETNEQLAMEELEDWMDGYMNGNGGNQGGGDTTGSTLGTVTGTETTNTEVKDSLENKVVVPAGFKVVNPEDNVEDGIIIEDVTHGATTGSQFVWIPVGTIHREEKEDITITLERYVFNSDGTINTELSKTKPTDQLKIGSDYYTEGLKDSSTTNTHAKDIETFISKVNSTGGYYIGRYEARDGTTDIARTSSTSEKNQLVCTADNYVYNYVTQIQAASLSQNMYSDRNFESDLMNSYAWDTAIVFIQECSGKSNYSIQTSLNNGSLTSQGTNNLDTKDVVCNIYDMASNCKEWSTETIKDETYPFVSRGGCYNSSTINTTNRYCDGSNFSRINDSFRPLLYLQ